MKQLLILLFLLFFACENPFREKSTTGTVLISFENTQAQRQESSVYDITITGRDMDSVISRNNPAGERVSLKVTAGRDRKLHIQRRFGSVVERDTTVTFDLPANTKAQPVLGPRDLWTVRAYRLSVNIDGGGSVSKTPDGVWYSSGQSVTLRANPESGYEFDRWSGDASSGSREISIRMDSTMSVTTHFREKSSDSISVEGITLDKSNITLTVGASTEQLRATVLPENASNKNVTWSSSDTSVATPIAVGTATITVTTEDGGRIATCAVTVSGGGEVTAPTGMVRIPAGGKTLTMGADWGWWDAPKTQQVTFTSDFYMSIH